MSAQPETGFCYIGVISQAYAYMRAYHQVHYYEIFKSQIETASQYQIGKLAVHQLLSSHRYTYSCQYSSDDV